jgi:hypothetical protein
MTAIAVINPTQARRYPGAHAPGRTHTVSLGWVALIVIAFSLAACGGGGGEDGSTRAPNSSGGSTPPAGGTPASGPPPTGGTSPTANPTFTLAFAQFLGIPKATVAADMDNDGRMDIVVLTTDHFASGDPGSDAVYVFYQRDGGFDVAAALNVREGQSLAACDIDGDGKREILVGYNGVDLSVYRLAADGTLLPPTTLAGVRSFSIDCVDLDGDGKSDVVTSGKVGVEVQILLQRGGILTEVETFPTSASFGFLIFSSIGDINGDGKPDILFSGFDFARGRQVFITYLQIDGGRFIPAGAQRPMPRLLDFPLDPKGTGNGLGVNSLAIVDLFSNSMRNIVAAVGGNLPNSHIVIATYASDGQLVSAPSFPTGDNPKSLRVVDVDGDGRNDLVVFHNGFDTVGVHYQNSNGSFREEQRLFTASFGDAALTNQAIAIGDFDSNGKRDIALGSQSALFVFFQD